MHIWHHAKELPAGHRYGVNFGVTLSVWDYIFRTNYIPHEGRDIPLGFDGIEEYPEDFLEQQLGPFRRQQDGAGTGLEKGLKKPKLAK